jgi:hypothetical protein
LDGNSIEMRDLREEVVNPPPPVRCLAPPLPHHLAPPLFTFFPILRHLAPSLAASLVGDPSHPSRPLSRAAGCTGTMIINK